MECHLTLQGLHVHGQGYSETYLTYTGQAMYELLVSSLLLSLSPSYYACPAFLFQSSLMAGTPTGKNSRHLTFLFGKCYNT